MEGESVAGIAMPEGDPGAVRDAAQQLRRVAGGFDHVSATVGDAVASVPDWEGAAALMFSERCTDYQGAAGLADDACESAARALDTYAEHLATARKKVHAMQVKGRELETEEKNALAAADEARGRLRGAQMSMKLSAMDAPVDGGAAMEAARHDADRAAGDIATAADRATKARTALDQLIRDARTIREHVEEDGRTAAGKVRGAADQLPTVVGAPAGGVGGTPIGSHSESFEMGVTIVVVRIGGSTAVIKEHTVDGKWRVTVVDGVEGGFEFDPVPGAGVDGGKVGRLGAGADVQAAFLAQYKHGKVYEFDNETLADRYIYYQDKYVPDSPSQVVGPGHSMDPNALGGFYIAQGYDRWQDRQKPVEEFREGGIKAKADVSLEGAVDGGASVEDVLGSKVDTKTHAMTTYSKTSAELSGQVGLQVEAGGKVKGEAITAYTHDRAGRPTAFSVTVSGSAEGHAGFTGSLESEKVSGGLSHHENQGVRIERQMTLDLSDPANRDAVERYMHSGGTDPAASAELADRLHDHARVDQRVYDTGSTKSGANIDTKIVKIDGSMTTEEAKLRSLAHNGPGGPRIETVQ
jgi:type VII secretion system ESX-1 substrate